MQETRFLDSEYTTDDQGFATTKDNFGVTEKEVAVSEAAFVTERKGTAPEVVNSFATVAKELQALQRQRAVVLKSRNMQANRIQAVVAGTLGYSPHAPEKERVQKFKEAYVLTTQIAKGADHPLKAVVKATLIGIDAFNEIKARLEKEMVAAAKKLPLRSWVEHKDRRGFGLLFFSIIVGETGDLCNYDQPSKVWRRLGCAPWTFNPTGEEGGEKTLMGATWRSGKEGKLPASEWEKFGYSPRRRSITYLVGESIVKQNDAGPYRKKYDEAKAEFKFRHTTYSDLRCHRHGMLVATKQLLLDLWIAWNEAAGTLTNKGQWVNGTRTGY